MHRFKSAAFIVTSLFTFLTAPLMTFADLGDGCIITQTDGMACMHLNAGTVGQTFTPCREGLLDYLVLYTGSSDDVSFAAELRILHGTREMHTQQVILQSSERQREVHVRMARQPYLYPGETYTLELKVPAGKQLSVAYTENDQYSFGNMTINGLLTPYDLTFEAGIRSYHEPILSDRTDRCFPEQIEMGGEQLVSEVRRQSFQLCEEAQLLGLSLGYSSPVDFSGDLLLMHENDPYLPVAVLPFSAESTVEGRLVATSSTTALLEPGKYHFEVRVHGEAQAQVGLFTAANNPYTSGTLYTIGGPTDHDLSFSVIIDEPIATPETLTKFDVLTGYESHACAIAQPYHNRWQAFTNTELMLDLPLCDDGKLQNVYLPARASGIVSAIVYHIKDQNGRILFTGNVRESHLSEGKLVLELNDQQAVYFQNYTLVLDIPRSASLELGMSSHSDHGGFEAKTTSENVLFHPSFALGMEPFAFEEVSTSVSPPVKFRSFPNPFNTNVTIELSELSDREVTVRLFSVLGQELAVAHTDGTRAEETVHFRLDEHLERGYYTLRIESGDHVSIDTLVKQ